MTPTTHALKRWAERFPTLNMAEEYAFSRRCGKATRAKLNLKLSKSKVPRDTVGGGFRKYYYLVSPSKVIFVMQSPERIITVYPLNDEI